MHLWAISVMPPAFLFSLHFFLDEKVGKNHGDQEKVESESGSGVKFLKLPRFTRSDNRNFYTPFTGR